jgi:phage baseplate assembly protein W
MAISRSDKFTQNSAKFTQRYSDFLIDLNPHPVVRDIVKYIDEMAVSKAIRNLILTDRGERLYQSDIGSSIRSMLFEPMSSASGELISTFIQSTIKDHEPRAVVLQVNANPNYDKNLYSVTIVYMVINKTEPTTLNIALERIR